MSVYPSAHELSILKHDFCFQSSLILSISCFSPHFFSLSLSIHSSLMKNVSIRLPLFFSFGSGISPQFRLSDANDFQFCIIDLKLPREKDSMCTQTSSTMTPLSPFGDPCHSCRSSNTLYGHRPWWFFTCKSKKEKNEEEEELMTRKEKEPNVMEPASSSMCTLVFSFSTWTIKAISQSNHWKQTSSRARLPRLKRFPVYSFFSFLFFHLHCFRGHTRRFASCYTTRFLLAWADLSIRLNPSRLI